MSGIDGRFSRKRQAAAGLGLVAFLCLAAALAPVISPCDPNRQADLLKEAFQPPSWSHPLGTDGYARDILSRVIYGARVSLSIGFFSVAIAVSLGTLVGALAGYLGGKVDSLLMRIVDMLLSFPRLVLLLTAAGLFGRSFILIILILGLTGWMGTSRLVRGQVLSLKEQDFVKAAQALGTGTTRILLRHLIPNTLGPVIVSATLGIAQTILLEASLSFLSLGTAPPTASWGAMVNEGRIVLGSAPWVSLFPGLAIVLSVLSFHLVGEGLRESLDPKTCIR
jgi:peptide/nickel transport system permease protein